MLYDGLNGIYDMAACDRFAGVPLVDFLGRSVDYVGADGCFRRGTVSAVVGRDQDGRPCAPRAVLQVGYASTWMSLEELARRG